ncbi:MAG: hypothetical protein ABWJ97_06315 [Thermoproteus sp.]
MDSEYINRLLGFLEGAERNRGTVIVIKIDKICSIDRRCSWYIYRYMKLFESKGIVYKWKKGTWILDKDKFDLLQSHLLALLPRKYQIK